MNYKKTCLCRWTVSKEAQGQGFYRTHPFFDHLIHNTTPHKTIYPPAIETLSRKRFLVEDPLQGEDPADCIEKEGFHLQAYEQALLRLLYCNAVQVFEETKRTKRWLLEADETSKPQNTFLHPALPIEPINISISYVRPMLKKGLIFLEDNKLALLDKGQRAVICLGLCCGLSEADRTTTIRYIELD